MNDIFSKRLRSARILAALSQDDLVERMDHIITKNAISKYEQGKMMADSKILIALSKALNVKPDYFFRPYSVEIEKLEFRKKQKTAVKDILAIRQTASDQLERYLEIEQFLNIENTFVNPISDVVVDSQVDIEHASLRVRKAWDLGLDAIPNVINMLEEKGIKVVEIDAPDTFDGFSGWAENRIPIIVINKNFNTERKRLTALHEAGHLLLNLNSDLTDKEKERQCFQFAGAMLLPETTLKSEIGEIRKHLSLNELITLKESFGISIQAIMARAKDLKIIDESNFIQFRIRISKNRTENGWGEYKGQEMSIRFNQLVFRAAAEEVISLSQAANFTNQKLAEFRKSFVVL
jgi:Zn-dependent peptidase ImmA (M78 family)/DNA-binding XRE family transcriptional regulator